MLGKFIFFSSLIKLLGIAILKSIFGIRFNPKGFSHLSTLISTCGRLSIGNWYYLGRNVKIELLFAESIKIGKRFTFKDNSLITSRGNWRRKSGKLLIGNNVGFSEYASIYLRGDITIGDNCIFGPGVKLFSDSHTQGKDGLWRLGESINSDIEIGENVWCGAGVTIMSGITIGSNAVIGAGSVVTKNIPSNEIWAGVPAKKIR